MEYINDILARWSDGLLSDGEALFEVAGAHDAPQGDRLAIIMRIALVIQERETAGADAFFAANS
jgi:hypothetical protein